jgi:hypothetical protein
LAAGVGACVAAVACVAAGAAEAATPVVAKINKFLASNPRTRGEQAQRCRKQGAQYVCQIVIPGRMAPSTASFIIHANGTVTYGKRNG